MSNVQKTITFKAPQNGTITELMPKTTGDQVYLNDTTTLSPKIADMVSAINLRAKKTEVEEMIKNAPKGDTGVCLSQAEYNALTDEEKDSDITYYIYDAESGGGSGGGDTNSRWISQAEYDALSEEEKASDTTYYIYDADTNPNAAAIPFTSENYTATNVEDALEEVKSEVTTVNSNLNVRYNQQTDKLQLLIDGVWVDWKTAGINEYNVLAKNQNINIGNSDTMWSVVSGNKGNPVNYTLNTKTVGQSGAILIGSTSANAQIHLQSPVIDCSSYDKAIISASMVSTGNGFIYYYANGGAMQFIKTASATGESLSVTDYELDITNFDTIQIGVGSGTTIMNFNYSITKFILTN